MRQLLPCSPWQHAALPTFPPLRQLTPCMLSCKVAFLKPVLFLAIFTSCLQISNHASCALSGSCRIPDKKRPYVSNDYETGDMHDSLINLQAREMQLSSFRTVQAGRKPGSTPTCLVMLQWHYHPSLTKARPSLACQWHQPDLLQELLQC